MAYANTDHLFSQPIRYYKANDPYYYEVDNIPIRQLEENVLWVRDQIDSLIAVNDLMQYLAPKQPEKQGGIMSLLQRLLPGGKTGYR